jgi:hypothetical protein
VNSDQRRKLKRLLSRLGISETQKPPDPRSSSSRTEIQEVAKRKERVSETLTLFGYACGLGSWAWSVVAPESSVVFASILFFLAVVFAAWSALRAFEWSGWKAVSLCLVAAVGYAAFDYQFVVAPQRGKEFKTLLAEGYHLTDECGSRSAKEPLPSWLHDQSTAWQARVLQLVTQKLDYKYLQMWRGSVIVGLVSDVNMTAYQCTNLSVKIGALETIIAENYDSKLVHQKYEGPLYWFESVDGKVDISEALKNGGGRFTIHESAGDGSVKFSGELPPKDSAR